MRRGRKPRRWIERIPVRSTDELDAALVHELESERLTFAEYVFVTAGLAPAPVAVAYGCVKPPPVVEIEDAGLAAVELFKSAMRFNG